MPEPDQPLERPGRPDQPTEPGGWSRLLHAGRPHASRAGALASLLALLLGFALATQVHQTRTQGLDSLRQSDLVGVLDDVSQRTARLDTEARSLETTRDQLASGSGSDAAAIAAAQQRLDTLRILAGTVGAHGPGIRLRIDDPRHKVTAVVLLDALEELRDAGAEAIQLGSVRVIASSFLADVPSADNGGVAGVSVDGVVLAPPYVLSAVGDAQTLASAMEIPGGLTDSVRQLGARPTVTPARSLSIDALHTFRPPRYAQAVPSDPSGR